MTTAVAPILNDRRARILCSLGSVPQRLADLAQNGDLGRKARQIQKEVIAARDDGWPVYGNPIAGYRLVFDGSERHEVMQGELIAAGNRLYGDG